MLSQPPFYGKQTWPPDIMAAVAQRLLDKVGGMTADRIIPSVWDSSQHLDFPPADRFITLFHSDFPVDQTDVRGGGEVNTAFDSLLEVTLYTRVEADLENRSGQFYAEQVNGVYSFAKSVIAALQMYSPDDGNTNPDLVLSLLRRPMRIQPGWSVRPMSAKNGSRWGVVPTKWQVSFVSDLGEPYP